MTGNVVSLDKKRSAVASDSQFQELIDRDIKANPSNVRAMPKSLVERFEALKAKVDAVKAEERLEC